MTDQKRVYLVKTWEAWDIEACPHVVGVYETEADAARAVQAIQDANSGDPWEEVNTIISSAPFHERSAP